VSDGQNVELWCVHLAAAADALQTLEQHTARLSVEDLQRADAFSDDGVRNEWLAARIALRLLIEHAAGPSWRGVAFAREERGRPHLEGSQISFSLSHAPGLALIGIARAGRIGVDVERTRTVRIDAHRRARIREAGAAMDALPFPAAEGEAFLQAWVRLEAVAKADGCGIGRLLTRLGISGAGARAPIAADETRARAAAVLAEGPAACVRDLQLGEGVFAAVALSSVAAVLPVHRLPTALTELEKLVK
jgi:4'-phosphopantetheinyl transferase